MSRRYTGDGPFEGLKRVTRSDRAKIKLAVTLNRFWRKREDNRVQGRLGPGCCRHCGSEPCGGSWGVLFSEESARCCDRCNHPPLPSFRPTHIIWHGKKAFFVREKPVGKAGAIYLREDGVCWFSRIADKHYFLGVELSPADFARFKLTDANGWPEGLKASDAVFTRAEAVEDEEYDDSDDGESDDGEWDDLGEDDPEDDEDSDGIEEEQEAEEVEDGESEDDDADDDDAADDADDAEGDDAEE